MSGIIKPTLAEVESLTSGGMDIWVLLPTPIKSMEGPKHRKEFEKAVKDARYDLAYQLRPWQLVNEAAREMSERGGIAKVQVFRVYHTVKPNVIYVDGKVVDRE
jgi:hypothetical protein